MVLHYPTPERTDELAREMEEMREFLSSKPGCVRVEAPHLSEDGTCLVGISVWGSEDAFLAAGLTIGGSGEIPEGETRPRERFHLHEVADAGQPIDVGVTSSGAESRSEGEGG